MLITVIICTRNRAEQLREVLESAAEMRVPAGLEWEFLLVDNGSSDHTPDVVAQFAGRLPIRHVPEPCPGLSNARNRGLSEARGDYICWTDDDVRIDPDWLSAYASAFADYPQAAFFGGPIEPVLEGAPPQWLKDNWDIVGTMLAERDLGAEPLPLQLEGNRLPYGANYAIRTADQKRHPYDPELGVSPRQRRLGEESKSILGVVAEGGAGVWVPGARVRHLIPASRQTLDYVRQYQRAAGETWAYLADSGETNFIGPSPDPKGRHLMGVPLWVWRGVVQHWLAYTVLSRVSSSRRWLIHLREHAFFLGALQFWLSRRRVASRRPA